MRSASGFAEALGYHSQKVVAAVVAEGVIDFFEAFEIDEEDGEWGIVLVVFSRQRLVEPECRTAYGSRALSDHREAPGARSCRAAGSCVV